MTASRPAVLATSREVVYQDLSGLRLPKQRGPCFVSRFLEVRVIHEHRVPS
jgi:hypothetical protein